MFVLNSSFSKTEANELLYKIEQDLIASYKKIFELTNLTDGGAGMVNRVISDKTRLKMSQSAKNRPLPKALIDNQKPKACPLVKWRKCVLYKRQYKLKEKQCQL